MEYLKGKIEKYLIKEFLKHNLVAYHNKAKKEALLRSIGLLLPVEHTSTSGSYILPKMMENVNKKILIFLLLCCKIYVRFCISQYTNIKFFLV